MQFLYPCDPFSKNEPDEVYADEYKAALAAGLTCVLFSVEDAAEGKFRPRPALDADEPVTYRGWMLNEQEYARLFNQVQGTGAVLQTTPEQYVFCHHLPKWYSLCAEFTPSTLTFPGDTAFTHELDEKLAHTGWDAFFVKDYVKSLTTSRGSIAKNIEEVHEVLKLIMQYRGTLEGGLCVREYEPLNTATEERYFVWQGVAYGRDGSVPEMVQQVASRVGSSFFSVDVCQRDDGVLRLIEIGDGQVSDTKKWTPEIFIRIFV